MSNTATKKYLLGLLDKSDNLTMSMEREGEGEGEGDSFPSYLYDKNSIIIQKEISDVCIRENIPQKIYEKLTEYRYVDKICDLIRGKHVRWVRLSSEAYTLTKGGIVTDIKFLENGIYILIKNARNQFIQYKFDDCITFQKLSTEELLYIRICC